MGKTGRRLVDREHLRNVEKTTQMRQNQLRAILIFLIIPKTYNLQPILTPLKHRKPKESNWVESHHVAVLDTYVFTPE